jgi:GTP-binding protein HflX
MLSDTVGFVRDLPHNLVASFRATLEEATHADLLLIVLDVSDPAAELQYDTVQATLRDIFDEARKADEDEGHPWREPERILLLNKADALPDNRELLIWRARVPGAIPFCAREPGGLGHAELADRVADRARGPILDLWLTVPLSDARTAHLIEHKADVLAREYTTTDARFRARIGRRQLDRLRAAGARIAVSDAAVGAEAPGGRC